VNQISLSRRERVKNNSNFIFVLHVHYKIDCPKQHFYIYKITSIETIFN